jgi:segregation and condensation protein A
VGYQVSTAVFEGPFDLLLHLVTKEQVDIWELSLSSIVDEYLATIEGMQALDLSVATEFLLTAAVLLELKARRLLPGPSGDGEEELALWEERDLLLARLLECKTFKDASLALARLMESADQSVPRRAGLEERFVGLAPDLLEGVTASRLYDTMTRLLVPKPVPRVNTDHVAPIRASVADTLEQLLARLPGEGRTTFRRLTEGLVEPLEVIVYFLALLELCKRGAVDLEQAERLGELRVNWLGLAPDYEALTFAPVAWDGVPAPVLAAPVLPAPVLAVPVLAGADMSVVDEYEG